MSNKITIKHGKGIPNKAQLAPCEFGYSEDKETVYFRKYKGVNGEDGTIVPITPQYTLEVVDKLPDPSNAKENVIYIVPDLDASPYILSEYTPSPVKKFWIDSNNGTLNYYDPSYQSWISL